MRSVQCSARAVGACQCHLLFSRPSHTAPLCHGASDQSIPFPLLREPNLHGAHSLLGISSRTWIHTWGHGGLTTRRAAPTAKASPLNQRACQGSAFLFRLSSTENLDPALKAARGGSSSAHGIWNHTWGYGGLATRSSSSKGARARPARSPADPAKERMLSISRSPPKLWVCCRSSPL